MIKNLNKKLIIYLKSVLLLILVTISSVLSAEAYDFTAAKNILNDYVENQKLAGGVLLVMKDGEELIHYATGKQNIEANQDMTTNSLFRIASQTKALTSVGIMILKERGLLKVSDPVSKFIPSFKNTKVLVVNKDKTTNAVPANREITIHDLLTHSSGISYGWGDNEEVWEQADLHGWYFANKDKTVRQALVPITDIPHQAQPGTEFVYGHSTDILGVIIELVSGHSLNAFFQKEMLKPLAMKDTYFYVPIEKTSRLSTVYNSTDTVIKKADDSKIAVNFMESQGHYVNGPRKAFSGGAGLVSTSSDYAKFLSMLLNKGTLNKIEILSEESVSEMIRNQIPYIKMDWNNGFGYGFTLEIADKGELKGKTLSYGWGGAYHSNYYVRPEDGVIVIYLTQLIPTNGLKDWEEIDAAIKIALDNKDV